MKKLLIALFIVLSTKAYAGGCYGHKPYKPTGYCDSGSWQLICTNGQWVWVCVDGNSYIPYY
jgi:hypothetical protein